MADEHNETLEVPAALVTDIRRLIAAYATDPDHVAAVTRVAAQHAKHPTGAKRKRLFDELPDHMFQPTDEGRYPL